jgi:hypothetical protein
MRALAESQKRHLTGCAWFWAWVLVGVGFAFGFVSFVGVFAALPSAAAAFFLARRRPVRGVFGLVTGAGAMLLVIAYLQREGPGTVCTRTVTGVTCDQHLNPLPWLVLGLALFAAGVVAHARRAGGA